MTIWPAMARRCATIAILIGFVAGARAAERPRFGVDGRMPESGLLARWPEGGPRLVWSNGELGQGMATVAIAGGRIYTAGEISTQTVVSALEMDGRLLWQTANGAAAGVSPPGARATPTFDGGRIYHMNSQLGVVCLDAATGKKIWSADLIEKFGGRTITWALAESLLVDGARLICTPGGERVGMVALDKATGATLWTCEEIGDKPSYATPALIEWRGLRQIVTMTANAAVGVAAESGRLLWRYEHKVPYEANCVTPLFDRGKLFLFGTWGRGATMLKLNVKDGTCAVEEAWRTTELDNEHGGVVLLDGYLYGQADGNHKSRHWACLEAATGRTMWSAAGLKTFRSGTTTFADGLLYVTTDGGIVALQAPDPREYRIVSQFQLPEKVKGNNFWAHPVICDGRLYLRYGGTLYCYDIKAKKMD